MTKSRGKRGTRRDRYFVGTKKYRDLVEQKREGRPEVISVSLTSEMKDFLAEEAARKGTSINFEAFERLLLLHGQQNLDSLDVIDDCYRMNEFARVAGRALDELFEADGALY